MVNAFPKELQKEPEHIPEFWISTVEEVKSFLETHVHKGTVQSIGNTAGGRPMLAAFYGEPRRGKGTTTYSGARGCKDLKTYLGPDYNNKVYVGLGAVHGDEWEGLVGLVNLIAVLETGRDLRGKQWPEITASAKKLNRIIILPITNVDGRARLPVRMRVNPGTNPLGMGYFGVGVWKNGKPIGWPACKEFIPLDPEKIRFPGGYPNDAGVNIQHDDFFGRRQPETEALLNLVAAERPDLVLNMHTGAPAHNWFIRMHRPFADPVVHPVFDALYRRVHTRLAQDGLQGTDDVSVEADPALTASFSYNLDTAINLHSGAISVLVESPAHYFDRYDRNGNVIHHTPETLLDAHLTVHQEAMGFLANRDRFEE